MKIKDVMSRLSYTFEYEDFKNLFPVASLANKDAFCKAVLALRKKELEMLEPAIREIVNSGLPKGKPVNLDAQRERMRSVADAIDRWREELMPDYHRFMLMARIVNKYKQAL